MRGRLTEPAAGGGSLQKWLAGAGAGAVAGLCTLVLVVLGPSPSVAQNTTPHLTARRAYPPPIYYTARHSMREGDYPTSLKGLVSAANLGRKSIEGRWLDSICYYAMIGECYYQMGDHAKALENFDAAAREFLREPGWIQAINFPPALGADTVNRKAGVPWGPGNRPFARGKFPDTAPYFMGNIDQSQVIERGGVVRPAQFIQIDVQEIVRCTALALRRRADILGPVCPQLPLTKQLENIFDARIGLANHWSSAWVQAQKGMAQIAAGNDDQAIATLTPATVAAGQFDHPLTATVLLELGKIAFRQGRYDAAAEFFYESSLSAAVDEDPIVLNEAFLWASRTSALSGKPQAMAALVPAIEWSRRNRMRTTQATLALVVAGGLLGQGQPDAARPVLAQFQQALGRRAVASPALLAEYQLQTARLELARGRVEASEKALQAAVTTQRPASTWLFQIAHTDRLFVSNAFTDRMATQVYEQLLRQPTANDWRSRPLDTITVQMTPHEASLALWLEASLLRKDTRTAINISDRIRNHRFTLSLPHGGRLLALRWVLEADESALSDDALRQRQDLVTRYPEYQRLATEAAEVRAKLRALPLADADGAGAQEQTELAKTLGQLASQQEQWVRSMAMRGEYVPVEFPPRLEVESLHPRVSPGTLVLSFISTRKSLHAFMFSAEQDTYAHWEVPNPNQVAGQVAKALRAMSITDGKKQYTFAELSDNSWRAPAAELTQQLIEARQFGFWNHFEELVIVPDGSLWHLPFEILQIPDGSGTVSLADKVRIRYAPSLALSVPDRRRNVRRPNTMVEAGQLVRGEAAGFSETELQDWQRFIPNLAPLPAELPGPVHVLKTRWDQLVVLDELPNWSDSPWSWSPLPRAGAAPENQLFGWMHLPWGAPHAVLLPGQTTSAASGLKQPTDGPEVPLVLMGLMAGGTRTVLMSRWPSGGQTSYDLMREFLRTSSHDSALFAWNRAVVLVKQQDVDPAREPRVRAPTDMEDPITAEHPFFWAGYMLVDTGYVPDPPEQR